MSRSLNFNRVYHPYNLWEEVAHNMWGSVADQQEWVAKAVKFTSDHALYGSYMRRIVREWPISCENALTDSFLNKRAWVGHAACALAIGCPEYIVRIAWSKLTDEQRFLANKEASGAIREWQDRYAESQELHPDMGGTLLCERDT